MNIHFVSYYLYTTITTHEMLHICRRCCTTFSTIYVVCQIYCGHRVSCTGEPSIFMAHERKIERENTHSGREGSISIVFLSLTPALVFLPLSVPLSHKAIMTT